MSESLGLDGGSLCPPGGTDTSLSEQDLQASLQAHKDYQENKLSQCLFSLAALQISRPEDPLVSHNLSVVKYTNGEINLEGLLESLETIYGQVISAGSDMVEEGENPALIYNLALAYFLRKDLGKADHLLRKVGGEI